MKARKYIICVITSFFITLSSQAQSQLVADLADAVVDITGSFMDNPHHHANTVKIYDHIVKLKSVLDELHSQVPFEAKKDFYTILNMKKIQKSLEHITSGIVGHSPASVSATDFEELNPMFDAFGWKREIIYSTTDITLYKYSKDDFWMVFAKNTRPKKDGDDYNAVSYECYAWDSRSKKDVYFMGRIVFGGNYQFVNCNDDEIKSKEITKVTSKRGNTF